MILKSLGLMMAVPLTFALAAGACSDNSPATISDAPAIWQGETPFVGEVSFALTIVDGGPTCHQFAAVDAATGEAVLAAEITNVPLVDGIARLAMSLPEGDYSLTGRLMCTTSTGEATTLLGSTEQVAVHGPWSATWRFLGTGSPDEAGQVVLQLCPKPTLAAVLPTLVCAGGDNEVMATVKFPEAPGENCPTSITLSLADAVTLVDVASDAIEVQASIVAPSEVGTEPLQMGVEIDGDSFGVLGAVNVETASCDASPVPTEACAITGSGVVIGCPSVVGDQLTFDVAVLTDNVAMISLGVEGDETEILFGAATPLTILEMANLAGPSAFLQAKPTPSSLTLIVSPDVLHGQEVSSVVPGRWLRISATLLGTSPSLDIRVSGVMTLLDGSTLTDLPFDGNQTLDVSP